MSDPLVRVKINKNENKKKILTFVLLLSVIVPNLGTITYDFVNHKSDCSMIDLKQIAYAYTSNESSGGGTTAKCFTKSKYSCTLPVGREAQDCNATGSYKAGEECTKVSCLQPNNRLKCSKPN